MEQHTRQRQSRRLQAAAWVCVAILLIASSAEAAHFCELGGIVASARITVEHSTGAAPTFCLICATAHSPSLAAAVVALALGYTVTRSAFAPAASSWSRLHSFALYVRPPPLS